MNSFEEIKTILREKSGKRLVAISVAVFLLITLIVFFAVFRLCRDIHLKQIDENLGEIPRTIDSIRDELLMRSRAYEEDILARAELGLKLCEEEDTLTNAEGLEQVCAASSAASVSLLNGQRELISTTGLDIPEEVFHTCVRDLEPFLPHLELFTAQSANGEETGKIDGKGFVLLPTPGNTTHSLLFEFSCDAILELHNAFDDGSSVLERIYAGSGGFVFAKSGDKLAGYPLDSLTDDQTSQLFEELTQVFRGSGKFRRTNGGSPSKIITLLDGRYLAALTHYSQDGQEDIDFLMTVPLKNVIGNGVYIAASISAIICWGIVLLQIYIYRRLVRKKAANEENNISRKWVCRVTWPGIVTVLVVTIVFSCMLLLLESRTNAAITTMIRRESVQQVIDWRKGQEGTIRRSFVDFYRTRAQMLADFLTERTDYRTHAGLEELSRIVGTDYLMLFDSNGNELVSSNSYKGFSVGENLSEAYRAVLLGYPDAVAGPTADPYTGRMQLGTAILMTDGEGQADGFLLSVYSAEELNAELERMSYENAVNSFSVREGYIAAAVSDEDGCFIAHTGPGMIGRKAADYLMDYTPGSSFEGFADYNGINMCISADAADGKTLLFMVPENVDSYVRSASGPMGLVVLLLTLVYYPTAGLLIARAIMEAEEKLQPKERIRNPIMVFLDGYSFFLTLFAIFAMIAAANDWWDSFDYVFAENWSRGVHLYSLWAALFILAATLWCEYLIRTVLALLESRLSLRAKTVTRLANSLIIYAANFSLVFGILSVFGVNTRALLASAGIVSIAVGMGAQSMASDLLAGFFMMLEDSVHVGDSVSVAGVTGRITDMGIRTTEITDEDGSVVILNNSKVSPVRNMSRKSKQQEFEDSPEDET